MLHEQLNPMGRLGCMLLSLILNKPMTPYQGTHLRQTRMPAPLLSVIQDMYNRDEYILKDGDKTARVHPIHGVIQGNLVPPAFFP